MTAGGFFEQKSTSPTGFATVVALHVAALGALALVKGPVIVDPPTPIDIYDVIVPPDPEPEPEPPPRTEPQRQQPTVVTMVPPVIDRQIPAPIFHDPPVQPQPVPAPPAPRVELARVELPPSVRIAAEMDPRYAGDLQPPYPPSMERAQRGGSVRVRVTIGTDGRVKAVERISATHDAFWEATERHALARWRFRPATLDGRPIESSKTMNVTFRIEG